MYFLCTHREETSRSKFADQAHLSVYFGTMNGLYRIHHLNAKRAIHSKHFLLDERIFPFENNNTREVLERDENIWQEEHTAYNLSSTSLPELEVLLPDAMKHNN